MPRIAPLLNSLRRWKRAFFLVSLFALGLFIHHSLPPAPRWSVPFDQSAFSSMWTGSHPDAADSYSPDGKTLHLIRTVDDPGVHVWDTEGWRLRSKHLQSFAADLIAGARILRSKDFRYVFLQQGDANIIVADTLKGGERTITVPVRRPAGVSQDSQWGSALWTSSRFVNRGSREFFLLSEGGQGYPELSKLHLITADTGELLATFSQTSTCHPSMVFMTDNDLFVFVREPTKPGERRLVTVWDVKERKVIRTVELDDGFLEVASDGKSLLCNQEVGWVLWDMTTGKRQELGSETAWRHWLTDRQVHFFYDNERIELRDGQLQKPRNLEIPEELKGVIVTEPDIFGSSDTSFRERVLISPDSRRIAIAGCGLWDAESGRILRRDPEIDRHAKFSRDSRYLIIGTLSHFKILDAVTGDFCRSLSYMPDGSSGVSSQFHVAGANVVACANYFPPAVPPAWKKWLKEWLPISGPAQNSVLIAADIASGRELLRVYGSEVGLLPERPDDAKVIVMRNIGDEYAAIEGWDVPARPRWGWVLSIPAGLAVAVLLCRRYGRRVLGVCRTVFSLKGWRTKALGNGPDRGASPEGA